MVTLFANTAGRFGVNPKEAERFFKFLIVGTIGFVVDFGVFNLLLNPLDALFSANTGGYNFFVGLGLSENFVEFGLAAVVAGTISFIAAIVSNFFWNRYWTYPDSRSKHIVGQFLQFTLVSITGIVFRIPIIALSRVPFTNLVAATLGSWLNPGLTSRLGENLALALSVLIILFWNFFINRYWTYSDVD